MNKKIILLILMLILFSSFASATLFSNTTNYYKFDTNNINQPDSLDNNNATAYNTPSFIPIGKINSAYYYNSSNTEYMLIDKPNITKVYNEFSTNFWFNNTDVVGTQVMFHLRESVAPNDLLQIYLSGNQIIMDFRIDGSFVWRATGETIGTGNWHMITFVYNGTNTIYYLDGVEISTRGNLTGSFTLDAASWDSIAVQKAPGLANLYEGAIDEISIFDEGLSASDITTLWNSGGGNQYPFTPDIFSITAINRFDSSSINTFNATINSTTYQTTNGTIMTPLLTNSSHLWNITIQSEDFFNRTFFNYNVSSNLESQLWKAEVSFEGLELLTSNNIKGNFTLASATKENNTVFYVNDDNFNVTFSATGYFNKIQEFNISLFSNQTLNLTEVFNSLISIEAFNVNGNTSISNFNINLSNTGFQSTTNGTILFEGIQNYNYTANFSATGFINQSHNLTVNVTFPSVFISAVADGDLPIQVRNSKNDTLITQQVTLILTDNESQQTFNFSSGTTVLNNLTLGKEYLIQLESLGFDNAAYIFTYTQSLSSGMILYMNQNGTEITFSIIDNQQKPISDASVKIETFVNGSYQTIGTKNTDIIGEARFILVKDLTHRITITKTNYLTQQFTFILEEDQYFITLELDQVFDLESPLSFILYDTSPDNYTLPLGITQFAFNVTALISDLEFFSIRLYNESNLIATTTNNNPSGGFLTLNFNTTPYNNSIIKAKFTLKRIGFNSFSKTIFYTIEDEPPLFTGSAFELRNWAMGNISIRDQIIIWTICIMVTGALMAAFNVDPNKIMAALLLVSFPLAWSLGWSSLMMTTLGIIVLILLISIIAANKNRL